MPSLRAVEAGSHRLRRAELLPVHFHLAAMTSRSGQRVGIS